MREHAIEAARDFAVPRRCAHCGSPHAAHRLPVTTTFRGVSPLVQVLDRKRYRPAFEFHYCLGCARPIRRRRIIGKVILGIGLAILTQMAIFFFVLPLSDTYQTWERAWLARHHIDPMSLLDLLVWDLVGGTFVIAIGWWMTRYSPAVQVVDRGGETLALRFRSRIFRDELAALNGMS